MKKKNKVTFISEIGMNHNGNLDLCYELIKQSKLSGADIVKFQLGWRDKVNEINRIDRKRIKQLIEWSNYFDIELMFSIPDIKDLDKVVINKDVVSKKSEPILIYSSKGNTQKIMANNS